MAEESTETKDRLELAAKTPKLAEVDGQKVQQHSLQEQIALDRYLASKESAESGHRGFRISKMVAGGAV
jgi:hypothetical protein